MTMFKKDLSKLAYIAGDWKGKLINISYSYQEIERETTERQTTMFLNWTLWITTEIFETDLAIEMLWLISQKYKAQQLEEGKATEVTYWDDFYSEIINTTIEEWSRYKYSDFDRYQDDNICPEKEVIWLPIWFINKIQKLFEDEIDYIFKWEYIVWVKAYTCIPLFIVSWINMPKQLNLLSWKHE